MEKREFFSHFAGRITFQTFDDKGKDRSLIKVIHYDRGNPNGLLDRLHAMNERGGGVYWCVNETNGKGRKASDVIKIRACYADLDGAPLARTLEYKPSLVVESSPGKYHAYWFTNDVPIEAFTAMQKNIIRHTGSDPAIHDLSRVLRVPGFYHQKSSTPFLTKMCGGSGDIFTYRDLVAFFPPQQVKKWSSPRYHVDKCPQSQTDFKGKYGASEGERNFHIAKIVGGMIKRGMPWSYIESEALKDGMSSVPPLSETEIRATLKSLQRYAK